MSIFTLKVHAQISLVLSLGVLSLNGCAGPIVDSERVASPDSQNLQTLAPDTFTFEASSEALQNFALDHLDAPIIAISESHQWTSELSMLRAHLSKALIESSLVVSLGLQEAPGSVSRVNYSLQSCSASSQTSIQESRDRVLESIANELPPSYHDASTVTFFVELCDWLKSDRNNTINIFGFDPREPWADSHWIHERMNSTFQVGTYSWQNDFFSGYTKETASKEEYLAHLQNGLITHTLEDHDRIMNALDNLIFLTMNIDFQANFTPDEIEELHLRAQALRASQLEYAALGSSEDGFTYNPDMAVQVREEGLYQLFQAKQDFTPYTRSTMIWGLPNTTFKNFQHPGLDQDFIPGMGHLLHKDFGSEAKRLFLTSQQAQSLDPVTSQIIDFLAQPNSIEANLHSEYNTSLIHLVSSDDTSTGVGHYADAQAREQVDVVALVSNASLMEVDSRVQDSITANHGSNNVPPRQ